MSAQRENWSSRSAFIIAAVGSAVGLGNIWRFPYVAYENGGGAFLLPYLIALFTAAIPLLFLDYAVGHKYQGSPPKSYKNMIGSAEGIGWWQTLVSLVIGIYYAAVLAWAGSYMLFSFGQKWGEDTTGFFLNSYLQNSGELSASFVPNLFVSVSLVWAIVLLIMAGGIKKGVELANKICMPLLVVMFGFMVAKAVTLEGAEIGLNAFFEPNWSAMTNPKVWLAAYGHVFFSLSVGFGIMVTYASYLGKNTNLTGSGLVVGLANSSFEILAGIGIFSAIGFMAQATGSDVSEVAKGGVGLAFFVFPKIISTMGKSGDLVGFLFFGSLVVAGISSLVSVLEVTISSFQDKFDWSRKKCVTIIGGGSALVSIAMFSSVNALTFVDVIDHFANNIGIVFGGLLSIIWVTWFNRQLLPEIIDHVNRRSSIKIGTLWTLMLTVVTPVVLIIVLLTTLKSLLTEGYGDYPQYVQLIFGWGILVFFATGSILLTKLKVKNNSNGTSNFNSNDFNTSDKLDNK